MVEKAPPRTNPFPGLRPFEESDSDYFFGREVHTEEFLLRLQRSRIAVVVGASGSGKSSFVRAGLVPALRAGRLSGAGWRVAVCRPGLEPMRNLARALCEADDEARASPSGDENCPARTQTVLESSSLGLVGYVRQSVAPDENVLVLVDQFEELFLLARTGEGDAGLNQAAAFVKLLLEASSQRVHPIYVVFTMRSDFLGDCDLFRGLPEAVNEGQYLIPRLTREECEEAVEGPVAMLGAAVTQRLVNQLLNDMGDDSTRLPIFQHALMRTWDVWATQGGKGPLDMEHYEAVGGMDDALSRHADEAFESLPDERSHLIAERMFKTLTAGGDDSRQVRRPTTLTEISAIASATVDQVKQVVEVFRVEGRSFLTPKAGTPLAPDTVVDISHESLIQNWHRLRGWADSERQSRLTYKRLSETARLHISGAADLLRDPELSLAVRWRETEQPNEAWARRLGRGFLETMQLIDLSLERQQHEREAEAEQRERDAKAEMIHRRAMITRNVSLSLAAGLILSLGLTAFAFSQRREAVRQAEIARQALLEADRQRGVAEEQAKEALERQRETEEILRQLRELQPVKPTTTPRSARPQ